MQREWFGVQQRLGNHGTRLSTVWTSYGKEWQNYKHKTDCIGKYTECIEHDVPCLNKNGARANSRFCLNCERNKRQCNGRVSQQTDKRCSGCEAVPNVSVDFCNDHERNCLGRCIRTDVPSRSLTGKSICSNSAKHRLSCGGSIDQEIAAKASINVAASRKRKIGRPRKDVTVGYSGHMKMVDSANPSLAETCDVDQLLADRVVKRSRTA